jgi:hypothetical protein
MTRLLGAGAFALAMLLIAAAAEARPCGRLERSRGIVVEVPCPVEGRVVRRDRRHFRQHHKARRGLVSRRPGVASGPSTDNDGRIVFAGPAEPAAAPAAGRAHSSARPWPASWAPLGGLVDAIAAPARFIRGALMCARNVNAALAARGIASTGSDRAKDFLAWGRSLGAVPGAVAVFHRRGGGHVAIVHSVEPDGTVIYLNPSSRRQAWQVGPYRTRPIGFRVPG